jgi:hypothetical protein
MLNFLSSEYQLYACGKNSSHALTLNQNHHFAKGSYVFLLFPDREYVVMGNYGAAVSASGGISFAALVAETHLAAGIAPANLMEAE